VRDLPRVVRVRVLEPVGRVAVQECPVLSPDEVLVRTDSVGICGGDVHHHRHGCTGDHVVESP